MKFNNVNNKNLVLVEGYINYGHPNRDTHVRIHETISRPICRLIVTEIEQLLSTLTFIRNCSTRFEIWSYGYIRKWLWWIKFKITHDYTATLSSWPAFPVFKWCTGIFLTVVVDHNCLIHGFIAIVLTAVRRKHEM